MWSSLAVHPADSHHVQRVAISAGSFVNEGRIWHIVTEPFEIPYRVLLPKEEECDNLLVPVYSSLSHVTFCAYRLESTWMQIEHIAGTAALSLTTPGIPSAQRLDIDALQHQLSE